MKTTYLKRIQDAYADLKKQYENVISIMDDTLDAYNDKEITKKQMKALMTESSKAWQGIKKELEETEVLLKRYT